MKVASYPMKMTIVNRQHCFPAPAATARKWVVIALALILLAGAVITPWGLAKSHGSAEVSALHHSESWKSMEGHGHSHEEDLPASVVIHVHHAGDHSHDHAHALPLGFPGLNQATAEWPSSPDHAGPWPALARLERPPQT